MNQAPLDIKIQYDIHLMLQIILRGKWFYPHRFSLLSRLDSLHSFHIIILQYSSYVTQNANSTSNSSLHWHSIQQIHPQNNKRQPELMFQNINIYNPPVSSSTFIAPRIITTISCVVSMCCICPFPFYSVPIFYFYSFIKYFCTGIPSLVPTKIIHFLNMRNRKNRSSIREIKEEKSHELLM
jgi:hypothetical protein